MPDFKIDQIDKEDIPLIKKPESFRTTLMQIYDESTSIFAKAHVNMYKIELKMEEVPDYVADCMEYLKTKETDLLRSRLDKIKQAADDVAALLKEVCDAFHSFGNLIQQVIEALMKSEQVITKTITDKIEGMIEEAIKGEEEAKQKKDDEFQQEIEEAERNVSEKRRYWEDTWKSKLGAWLAFLVHEFQEESLEHARQMLDKAKDELKNMEEKASARNRDNISNKKIQISWKDVRVDVKKTFDRNETLAILEDDLKYIVQLHIACLCMRRYFDTTKIYFDVETFPSMTDLSVKAENVEINAIPIEKLEESLQLTLESCAKTHHLVKMYVQVSDNHLLDDEASNDLKILIKAAKGDIC
jgi:nitrate reductase assembly molybdenum cofactor insertion protein NarJ